VNRMPSQLPNVNFSQITGVLEIVDDHKGKVDVARIASEHGLDIDELLPSIEAAELLGFVKVEGGDIELLETGHRLLRASLRARKQVLREQVLKTPIFQDVVGKLQKAGGTMDKDTLVDVLGFKLWTPEPDRAAKTIINWGRHTGILTFDADTNEIRLVTK